MNKTVAISHNDFYWTNRKRSAMKKLMPGQSFRLRLHQVSTGVKALQASIIGVDLAGHEFQTGWYEIRQLLDGIDTWAAGELIQAALPFVSTEDREFIKSGMSPSDWQDISRD